MPVFSEVRVVAAPRSASSLQRRMRAMVYRASVAASERSGNWFPDRIEGEKVVLKHHVADNIAAFRRWYSDPDVARLARYQDTPMREDEVTRFFQVRALGPESLTMAIHERST